MSRAALAICGDEAGGRPAFGPARAAPSAIPCHAGAAQGRARADRQRTEAHRRRRCRPNLKRAVQQEQDLAARLAQLKVRSGDVNVDLVTLRELEREAAAKRAVYEAYLLRAKETGEQRDINTANMSVISPAFPPIDPSGPSRVMITLGRNDTGLHRRHRPRHGARRRCRACAKARALRRRFSGIATARRRPATVAPFSRPRRLRVRNAAKRNRSQTDPASGGAAGEPTMNPLARLMERIRRPDPADLADAAGPQRGPPRPKPARPHANPQMNVPDDHAAGQRGTSRHVSLSAAAARLSAGALSLCAATAAAAVPAAQPQPAYPPQYAQLPQYPAHFAPQHAGLSLSAASRRSRPSTPGSRSRSPSTPMVVRSSSRRPIPAYPMQAPQAAAAAYPQEVRPGYAPAAGRAIGSLVRHVAVA